MNIPTSAADIFLTEKNFSGIFLSLVLLVWWTKKWIA